MAGNVIVKWLINGEGQVTQALVIETELNNQAVESCLVNEVKTWTFPKPKGGGTVIVHYPLVFKTGR
jgi:outer membrane biosynthesis protein TonB